MKVLALDMTLRNIGYSVWELRKKQLRKRTEWRWAPLDCGCISTKPDKKSRDYQMIKDIKCCQEILRSLEEIIETNDIKAIVVELLEGAQNYSAAKTFGLVEGVFAVIIPDAESV